ncbi:hypothetical protein BDN72DRAFT_577775 [Pluteus cervinus]|uniref:Uncharacterized protein n=1 Tax=Pluteus cervinus TaxID=181527 RepID=A0ACD3A1Q8_9AGAR|nr:hypothetical protein BDN72DRAFT_577775 [Pluteus cervinus]
MGQEPDMIQRKIKQRGDGYKIRTFCRKASLKQGFSLFTDLIYSLYEGEVVAPPLVCHSLVYHSRSLPEVRPPFFAFGHAFWVLVRSFPVPLLWWFLFVMLVALVLLWRAGRYPLEEDVSKSTPLVLAMLDFLMGSRRLPSSSGLRLLPQVLTRLFGSRHLPVVATHRRSFAFPSSLPRHCPLAPLESLPRMLDPAAYKSHPPHPFLAKGGFWIFSVSISGLGPAPIHPANRPSRRDHLRGL